MATLEELASRVGRLERSKGSAQRIGVVRSVKNWSNGYCNLDTKFLNPPSDFSTRAPRYPVLIAPYGQANVAEAIMGEFPLLLDVQILGGPELVENVELVSLAPNFRVLGVGAGIEGMPTGEGVAVSKEDATLGDGVHLSDFQNPEQALATIIRLVEDVEPFKQREAIYQYRRTKYRNLVYELDSWVPSEGHRVLVSWDGYETYYAFGLTNFIHDRQGLMERG